MAGSFHLEQLPQKFRTALVNENTLRAALQNEKDITEWINEFSKMSNTQWIYRRSRIGKHVIFREYLCHHSGYRKVLKDENGCNRRGVSKNEFCSARIKISLDIVRSKRSTDPFIKTGLYATIRTDGSHTHTLHSAQTLRFLQDQNAVLRDTFFEYFDDCMTATTAKRFHEHKLVLKNVKQEDFANGRVNPKLDTVNYWFKQWRLLNLGPRTDEKSITKFQEKKQIHTKVDVPPITEEDHYKMEQIVLVDVPDISFYDDFETVKPPDSTEVSPVPVETALPTLETPVLVIPGLDNNIELSVDEYQEAKQAVFQILEEKFQNHSSPQNTSDIKKFLKTIRKISTEEEFLQFLNAVPMTLRRSQFREEKPE